MLFSPFRIIPFLAVYSVAHLVVDAACAFLLLGLMDLSHVMIALLVYNGFAFVLQAPLGFLIDKMFPPVKAAIMGLILVALSFLFLNHVYVALMIAGTGSALFHVGGGSLVLSLKEKKATFSGIFIAPGAIGLAIGTYLSHLHHKMILLIFPVILLLMGGFVAMVKPPEFSRSEGKKENNPYILWVIVLIMFPIAVRSLIGLYVDFPWKENPYMSVFLIAAVALGKVAGGILADKYGLLKVGVVGFFIAAPCLAFCAVFPFPALTGVFVLSFTMPVTLIAMLNIMPEYKGLSFGLTTVALFLGALPVITGDIFWLKNHWMEFTLVLCAAAILFFALKFEDWFKKLPCK